MSKSKNVQNETTKLFSVGNTFRQATMQARIVCICCVMTWIRPMSRPNMKKKNGNNNEISDGVNQTIENVR